MSQEPASDTFNWVLAQANCSAVTVFKSLRTAVGEDVRHRNGLFTRKDGWKFEVHDDDSETFEVVRVVARGSAGASAVVRFLREGSRILIQGDDIEVDITAVLTLDAAGLCRLVVGEAMYSEWEVRRMALELLFFEETDDESE